MDKRSLFRVKYIFVLIITLSCFCIVNGSQLNDYVYEDDSNSALMREIIRYNGSGIHFLTIITSLDMRIVEVNYRNDKGITALMVAAGLGKLDLVQLFVQYGANVNETDNEERNALDHARIAGHDLIVEYLEQRMVELDDSTEDL